MKHIIFTVKKDEGKYFIDESYEYSPPFGMGPEQLRSLAKLNASGDADKDSINAYLRGIVTDYHTLKIKEDAKDSSFGIAYASSDRDDIEAEVLEKLGTITSDEAMVRWMRSYEPEEV